MQTLNTWYESIRPFIQLAVQAAIAPADTLTGLSLTDRDPQAIAQILPFLARLHESYFHVQTDGWEQIPDGQVLLIGSHNGGLAAPDTLMMTYEWFRQFGPERPIYALMEPRMWQALPAVARLAAHMGALRAEPTITRAALEQGASLLIYPGGAKDVFRPYALRHRIHLNGQRAFVKLALEAELPIVPLISYGAHATLIVLAEIHDQLEALAQGHFPWPLGFDPGVFPIYLGWPWGLAIGPLPNIPFPHPLHTRVGVPIYFERYGKEAARDRPYVEDCFHQVEATMQAALDQLVAEHEPPRPNPGARS